jgi:hypothetical protein
LEKDYVVENDAKEIVQVVDFRRRGIVWGVDFVEGIGGREWCLRGCAGGGFWGQGGVARGVDFGEGIHGVEWCWIGCAEGRFWYEGVFWEE